MSTQAFTIEPLFEITPAGRAYLRDQEEDASTVSDRWRQGFAAFRRGDIVPADPDEAEGWYCAENTAARWSGPWAEARS